LSKRSGVDVVETDTFGAFAIPLGEYGLEDQAYDINLAGAQLAREVANDYTTADKPRFVAGSMGPGTKFASLGQIRFADRFACNCSCCRLQPKTFFMPLCGSP
jgi:5-methyltetrahydrofolate--homocysteine methyltransferase